MFKRFIPGLLIVIVMLVATTPVVSSALSADDVQAQIQQLLVKIQELSAQLNELRARIGQIPPVPAATSTTPAMPVMPVKHRVCEVVNRPVPPLAMGGAGEDIRSLQEFLHDEGFLKPEATGYFGTMTHDAVVKWQTEQGIIGSETAVGAGMFGPRSRDFLKIRCQGGMPSGERFSATPVRGEAPLTVTFSTWLSGFHPNNISYTIDFGDGASEPATSCPAPADACTGPGTNTHTYTTNGSYLATLYKVIDPCAGQTACRAAIHREMVAKQMIQVGPIVCTMDYRPVCGALPIVCITTPCNPVPTTYGNKCAMESAGAKFLYEGECRPAPTSCKQRPACLDATPRCLLPEPSEGWCPANENKTPVIKEISGPTVLHVNETGTWKVRAFDPQNDALSYSVTWGDEGATNSSQAMASQAAPAFTQSTSFTHMYASAGTYTIVVIVHDTEGNEARTSTTINVRTGENPVACTLQYDPVCGRPAGCTNTCPSGMYCAALCRLPDPVTYSNKCFMQASGATLISHGACTATSSNAVL